MKLLAQVYFFGRHCGPRMLGETEMHESGRSWVPALRSCRCLAGKFLFIGVESQAFVPLNSRALIHFIARRYSTVTDLARLRGWSTSVPLDTAV